MIEFRNLEIHKSPINDMTYPIFYFKNSDTGIDYELSIPQLEHLVTLGIDHIEEYDLPI